MNADGAMSDYFGDCESGLDSCNNVPQIQQRPTQTALSPVPYEDRDPDLSYEGRPPTCMHFTLGWKLSFNRRATAKQTGNDLV